MANSQSICTSFKTELLNGHHNFGVSVIRAATTTDTFKAALYLASATISGATTVYTSSGEVSGTNYAAGGVGVAMATPPAASGTVAFVTPSASIVFTNVTLNAANFDAVLIYNSTQGNKAVSVHTFTAQTITAGTLTLTMPTNDASTGLIRLA
jgi:hypothetical protein